MTMFTTPNRPISRRSAEHYTWGDGCDGWHLVRTEGLSVIQEHMPPGTTEVAHRHARARQFFFVLSGELDVDLEGETHRLGPYTGLEIAPGVAHRAHNGARDGAHFLVISQPPSHGDREIVGPET